MLALLSQALSSGRSIGFAIVSAQLLDANDFGLLAIVVTLAIGASGLLRAAASHPLALVNEPPDGDLLASATRYQAVLAAAITTPLAGALLIAGVPNVLWLGALLFPLVAAQDGVRVSSLNLGRSVFAVSTDAIWVVLLAIAMGWCLATDVDSPALLVVVWAASAALAAVAVLVGTRSGPMISMRTFHSTFAGLGRNLTGQVALEIIPTRVLPVVIASTVAVEAAGSIRAAESLLGGATVVWSAVSLSTLRQARRRHIDDGERATFGFVAKINLLAVGSVVINSLIVWSLSDSIGEALFDDTWAGASAFIGPVAVLLLGQIALGVVSTTLRASLHLDDARRMLMIAAGLAVATAPASAVIWNPEWGLVADGLSLVVASVYGYSKVTGRRSDRGEEHEVRPASAR